MYKAEAKKVYIELYEKATVKLASAYTPQPEQPLSVPKEGQSNGTFTKR